MIRKVTLYKYKFSLNPKLDDFGEPIPMVQEKVLDAGTMTGGRNGLVYLDDEGEAHLTHKARRLGYSLDNLYPYEDAHTDSAKRELGVPAPVAEDITEVDGLPEDELAALDKLIAEV